MYWLKQRKIKINLIVMSTAWFVAVFDFYLIDFLMRHFKNAYYASITSLSSELVSYALSGILFKALGANQTFFYGYGFSCIGGFILL